MQHPLDLTGKTAVVIGGTSGIGLALSKGLAQSGANVVPTGRRLEQASAAADAVQALGPRSLVATCDVTDNASLEELLRVATETFGSIEILINCAGLTKRLSSLQFPDSDWDRILETNQIGRAHV